jgi:predicted alpha/beta-hydrolase family hydrolase
MNLGSRVKMFDVVIDHHEQEGDSKVKGEVAAIGGRSMGARAAVMAAKESGREKGIKKLVLVSYPLVSGDKVRDQILLDIEKDVKVCFCLCEKRAVINLT